MARTSVSSEVSVVPVTGSIGAVVEGVDLRDLDDERFAALHRALLDHQVLFVREQHLSEEDHLAFAARWGTPMTHPVSELFGDVNPVAPIEDTAEHPPSADQWHTDIMYWPEPPKIAVLCALRVPPSGGDTCWSDLYSCYDALSAPLREMCEGLRTFHSAEGFLRGWLTRDHTPEQAELVRSRLRGAVMPLVRTHDETGRHALFHSPGMSILDVEPALNEFLLRHFSSLVNDPNRFVRWRWQDGDVAIWDERCTNHRALSDHYPQYRLMRRCTVQGDRPFFRPAGADAPAFVATSA